MDERRTDALVFMAFDLLFLDGADTAKLPLIERNERLRSLFASEIRGLRFADHVVGDGPRFREHACKLGVEGVVSKRIDCAYAPGTRSLWLKSKCLTREEFVVVGWTEPAGSRSHFGALLLGYYTEDGRLVSSLVVPLWWDVSKVQSGAGWQHVFKARFYRVVDRTERNRTAPLSLHALGATRQQGAR
jgi:ATP-dependent DNA ligase